MAANNSTQFQESSAPTGILSSMSIIEALWYKSEGNMSSDELEWFSQATSHADFVARNLKSTVAGIGCLVNGDTDNGNFQDKQDVAELLFFLEESLGNIIGMAQVGHNAEYKLRQMAEQKLKQFSVCR